MRILQTYGLKQVSLTSDFAREEIADEIFKSTKRNLGRCPFSSWNSIER